MAGLHWVGKGQHSFVCIIGEMYFERQRCIKQHFLLARNNKEHLALRANNNPIETKSNPSIAVNTSKSLLE